MTLGSAADLSRHVSGLGTAVKNGQKTTLTHAGQVAKKAHLSVAPSRLRNVGKSGAKLSASYDVTVDTTKIKAIGPWQLIEGPSKPHKIRSRKRHGTRAILTPFGPRASVQHPGTRAKRLWTKGKAIAEPLVSKEITKQTQNIIKGAFSG